MMRIVIGLGALALTSGGAVAQARTCEDAWYQRNAIYKEAGYCFKTGRAISAFGNAGCSYDTVEDVPLSARQRAIVADLRTFERMRGCTP